MYTRLSDLPSALALPWEEGQSPCEDEGGAVCGIVRRLTDNPDLAGTLKSVIGTGFEILVIIVVALVVRAILNRAINRLIDRTLDRPKLSHLGGLGGRLVRKKDEPEFDITAPAPERRHQRAETIGSVLRSTVTVTVGTIAFIEILGKLGIDLAPIVASAGIVGVALGFGAQNLVKDFLSGIFMILEDQYGVGDVIDVGEATGTVESVGLRTTRLRDVNGVVWHVRNGEVTRIGNKSQGWSRALLDVPVGYGHDTAHARDVIRGVAIDLWEDPDWSPKILEEPEVWGVEDLGLRGVTIRLVVKTVPLAQWEVARELRERIKAAFDDAGIEIPYTQGVGVGWTPPDTATRRPARKQPARKSTSRKSTSRKSTSRKQPARK